MKTTDFKSFHYLENGDISFSSLDTIRTSKSLDEGSYKISWSRYPKEKIFLKKDKDAEPVKAYSFKSKEQIDNLIDKFFDDEIIKQIKELGFHHKVGLLFHGPEGTGKSSIMKHYYMRLIQEKKAIVFHIIRSEDSDSLLKCWEFIASIRSIQDNPIIIVLDEMDQFIPKDTANLKSIMDGILSITNCFFMASTNHLDVIPEAIKNRPSRFKYVLNIEGIETKEEVFEIMKKMLNKKMSDNDIEKLAEAHVNKSLDYIKQAAFDKIMCLETFGIKKNKIGFYKD